MVEPQHGDVSILLQQLGRSSTPDVPDSEFGITTIHLIFGPERSNQAEALIVGTPNLLERLTAVSSVSTGIPGLLPQQAESDNISYLIIDENAFHSGPWLGTGSGGSHQLAEDVFDAGRLVRARGGNVLYIPGKSSVGGADFNRIKSTATDVLSQIPKEHFEEGAPQSLFWQVCSEYANSLLRQDRQEQNR